MRPYQWVKNLFVFAPLIFAEKLYHGHELLLAALGFLLFSLTSGSVYLLNDIVDAEADRAHPFKRLRPIASGRLPISAAKIAIVVILLGVTLISLSVGPVLTAVILGYAAMNVAYSFHLKHVPFLDVTIIALGFIARVVCGALVIDVRISPWLIGCTFLVSLYLGLGKRRHELAAIGPSASHHQRRVLRLYNLGAVDRTMPIVGLLTLAAYVFYTLSADTVERFGTTKLVLTAPMILVGLSRFLVLAHRPKTAFSPTDAMLRDPLMIGVVVVWGVSVVAIIYNWI